MRLGNYRLVYGSLCRDISRGVVVCIRRMAATQTDKFRLAFAISLLAMPAFGASAGRISRIDGDHRNTVQATLVLDKLPELSESPTTHLCSLAFAEPCSGSYPSQFLDCNTSSSVFGVDNERLADNVICVTAEPLLFIAEPSHGSPSVLAGVPLRGPHLSPERPASIEVFDPNLLNMFTGNELAVAGGNQLRDSHVNAQKRIDFDWRVFGKVNTAKQVELVAAKDQVALTFNPVESRLLVLAEHDGDYLSSRERQKADPIHALEAHQPFVVGHRAEWLEGRASGLVSLKTVHGFCDGADGHLAGQAKFTAKIEVAKSVNRRLTESLGRETHGGGASRGRIEGRHGSEKLFSLCGVWQDRDLDG